MEHDLTNRVCGSIVSSYKNLDQPDFSFVLTRINEGMYSGLIDDIKKSFYAEDNTDLNYSSCLSMYIRKNKDGRRLMGLSLSLVGTYAYLVQYKRNGIYIVDEIDCIVPDERSLVHILMSHKIILLSLEDLITKLPIEVTNSDFLEGKSNIVFNLLFERDYLIQ
jgi:hypothetical protein